MPRKANECAWFEQKKWGEVESRWAKKGKEGGRMSGGKQSFIFCPTTSSLFFLTGSQLNLFPLRAFRNECLHCRLKQILWDGITNRTPQTDKKFSKFLKCWKLMKIQWVWMSHSDLVRTLNGGIALCSWARHLLQLWQSLSPPKYTNEYWYWQI